MIEEITFYYPKDFNPRTHEECDMFESDMSDGKTISIHALTRSATFFVSPVVSVSMISIHALTRSATLYLR